MIKVKFSDVEISKMFAMSNETGLRHKKWGSENIKDEDYVWIEKFKDRYGKDLSIGDRVLLTLSDDKEDDFYTG
ncbi:MAG: hypothetical protein LH629_14085, partial [Ignavibacteria bacterium]|nr:hypothetical protein [Ignavibacteria bacterium]